MPIFSLDTEPFDKLSIWNIEEDCDYFFHKLELDKTTQSSLNQRFTNSLSLRQFLASRYLIVLQTGHHFLDIEKDAKGKIRPIDGQHISISHSGNWACLSKSRKRNGIDIQIAKPSLSRIAKRFIKPSILTKYMVHSESDDLIYFDWGIKESIFKAYGQGGINYQKDIELDLTKDKPMISTLHKEHSKSYQIYYLKTANFYLSYVVEL